MDRKELEIILKEGEGYKIEFKEGISGLEKELVAFANASGGKILLGVTDDGKAKGIQITSELKSRIQDIANNCRPRIKIFIEDSDNILIVNVREGEDKPYECSSGFYKRIGPNSQKMTRDELLNFFKSEGKIRFDELTEPRFNYPKDFDKNGFRRFLQLAEISTIGDIERLLLNLGVAEKQEGRLYFNNTGVLFFGKNPQRFIPWSVFTVALFKDDAGVDIIDRKEIEGSLFNIVEEVMKFVRLYSKVAYRFTGRPRRENVYEYPFDAIREAVINSVMHKYYFEHGHNNILRFLPDRIRIENFWQRPSHFVLGKTVFRRNHIIADLFAKIHFGEKMGTGFERIREICRKENAPFPKIEFNENYFYVTFSQSKEYLKLAAEERKGVTEKVEEKAIEKVIEKVGERVTENQKRILEEITKNKYITVKRLSESIGISERKTQENIKKLKGKGLLKRVGPDKGGYWEILNK
jgi:ATP-dependent DNA helicase RecG